MKAIILKIMVNNDNIVTEAKTSGVDTDNVIEVLMMIGLFENLKAQYQNRLSELLKLEK